jgi:hypothetical protein
MTAHVVLPPRRVPGAEPGMPPVWASSCACGRWVRHADRDVVKAQMQSCRDLAKTPHDNPDREVLTDD